jgi:hypothetical protein
LVVVHNKVFRTFIFFFLLFIFFLIFF